MQTKRRKYWPIVVTVLTLAIIGLYLKSQNQLLRSLEQIPFVAIVYLLALQLASMAVNGLFLREFAIKFGIHLTPKEWFGLSIVTTMGNYITPLSGGMIARAAYLKQKHAFPYAQFATLLASNYLVNFWVIGVVGLFVLLTLGEAVHAFWQVLVFFAAVVIAISTLILFPPKRLPWNNRVARVVNTSLVGWELVKSDLLLLAKLAIYTLVNILLSGLSFWVAYDAVGSSISFRAALLVGLLAFFSILIKVTPGNLGIQEAVVSLSSGLLGTGMEQGFLVALLIRAATLAWAFTLGPIFSLLLTQKVIEPNGEES